MKSKLYFEITLFVVFFVAAFAAWIIFGDYVLQVVIFDHAGHILNYDELRNITFVSLVERNLGISRGGQFLAISFLMIPFIVNIFLTVRLCRRNGGAAAESGGKTEAPNSVLSG